jgi:Mg-chelatase subunit ChlD
LTGGTFLGQVPLSLGANEIVATATSLDGETREDSVTVTVSGPMSIAIDTPMRDTVVAYQDRAMTVEGTINSFEDLPEEVWPDPARWGVQSVVLRVNGSPPMVTTLEDGRFRGQVQLREGENHKAVREGEPALSISDRAVELVFDASNSMWGQLNGEPKMGIAKEILTDALDWLPEDLELSLRVYGHRHKHELKNCTDSELLVPLGPGSRDRIREAIASFRPRGQTPIAYSLNEVASDFQAYSGERAVVLVTDGIESCGGDPVSAARRLYEEKGLTVHVIGFGLGSGPDEDTGSLRAIAEAGRGRFLTARSAAELRGALAVTVGTPFEVRSEDRVVARGALGSDEAIHLPAGEYVVRVESKPPREVPVRLERERGLTVVVERNQGTVSHWVQPRPAGYTACSSAASATPSTFDPNRVPREVLQAPPAKYDFE